MSPQVRIAHTITQQLGGMKFVAMTGANSFVATAKGVRFKVPRYPHLRINVVEIDLNGRDLYDVRFLRQWPRRKGPVIDLRPKVELIEAFEDIDCEQLRPVFERVTGLATRL